MHMARNYVICNTTSYRVCHARSADLDYRYTHTQNDYRNPRTCAKEANVANPKTKH